MGSSSEMQIFINGFSRTFLSSFCGRRIGDYVPTIACLNKPQILANIFLKNLVYRIFKGCI